MNTRFHLQTKKKEAWTERRSRVRTDPALLNGSLNLKQHLNSSPKYFLSSPHIRLEPSPPYCKASISDLSIKSSPADVNVHSWDSNLARTLFLPPIQPSPKALSLSFLTSASGAYSSDPSRIDEIAWGNNVAWNQGVILTEKENLINASPGSVQVKKTCRGLPAGLRVAQFPRHTEQRTTRRAEWVEGNRTRRQAAMERNHREPPKMPAAPQKTAKEEQQMASLFISSICVSNVQGPPDPASTAAAVQGFPPYSLRTEAERRGASQVGSAAETVSMAENPDLELSDGEGEDDTPGTAEPDYYTDLRITEWVLQVNQLLFSPSQVPETPVRTDQIEQDTSIKVVHEGD